MTEPGLGGLLVSLQLSDSAFPSGFYTMSHGLEGFAQAGAVGPDGVRALLVDLLRCSVGPGDATALARAHEAASAGDWDRVTEVDRLLLATKLNAELRRSAVRSGRQVIGVARAAIGGPVLAEWERRITGRRTPGCQAVATAVAYAAAGAGTRTAVASDLFAFAASVLGAALRLRLADHQQVQVLQYAVHPVIEEVTRAALRRPLHDLGGCVPVADVASARHELAEARLFAS